MLREIFYTAVKSNQDGKPRHASGVTTQPQWPALKRELARQDFRIKSWYLLDEPSLLVA